MFICDECVQPIGPRVSPIPFVAQSREVTYTNKKRDLETREVRLIVSTGTEIVREEHLCPTCAKIPLITPRPGLDHKYYKAQAKAAAEHTKGCKKPIDECKPCQRIVEMFQSMALPALNVATENPLAPPAHAKLAQVVTSNWVSRSNDNTKRAKADYAATIAVAKLQERATKGKRP